MQQPTRWIGLLACATLAFVSLDAGASSFIGDLVYCDVDRNGIFDGDDFGLDGVDINIRCTTADDEVCADLTTTTGELDAQARLCADELTFDPDNPDEITGRYLVSVTPPCIGGFPRRCTVTIDLDTVPDECNQLLTPRVGGFPANDNDADFCDAEDGPFPENQPLGNYDGAGGCSDFPDATPEDGVYMVIQTPDLDRCNIQNDFALTPPEDEPEPEEPSLPAASGVGMLTMVILLAGASFATLRRRS